jgi:hypothetical protein
MFRTPFADINLSASQSLAVPRPTFQPAVEALEERVVLSPTTIPRSLLNGVYQGTLSGQVNTPFGVFRPEGESVKFSIRNGFVFTPTGQNLGNVSLSATGAISFDVSARGVTAQLRGQVNLAHSVPNVSGTWTVFGMGISGSGSWSAFRISR